MKTTNSLADWLIDPRLQSYFGNALKLKLAVLACIVNGGNLSDVAREHGVTGEAARKLARKASRALVQRKVALVDSASKLKLK